MRITKTSLVILVYYIVKDTRKKYSLTYYLILACLDFDMREKDKSMMMDLILHTADVGNPARPWELCERWTFRILTEFFN